MVPINRTSRIALLVVTVATSLALTAPRAQAVNLTVNKTADTDGNDGICGGTGKDRLIGGTGSDRFDGGPGADTCVGGPGSDRFRSCEAARQ